MNSDSDSWTSSGCDGFSLRGKRARNLDKTWFTIEALMMERYPAEAAQVENKKSVANTVVDTFNLLFTLKMLTPSGTLTMFRESCSAQTNE